MSLCEGCGLTICNHGNCECGDETCRECARLWNLEQEAEREANWQRNVIGPMFGFDKEKQ